MDGWMDRWTGWGSTRPNEEEPADDIDTALHVASAFEEKDAQRGSTTSKCKEGRYITMAMTIRKILCVRRDGWDGYLRPWVVPSSEAGLD
jgi:hypothetical protein